MFKGNVNFLNTMYSTNTLEFFITKLLTVDKENTNKSLECIQNIKDILPLSEIPMFEQEKYLNLLEDTRRNLENIRG